VKLQLKADLHTHTLASGHAYSTPQEMACAAYKAGLEIIALTDHGINMPGSPHLWFFTNMDALPRVMEGVTVLRGTEANIIGLDGKMDMSNGVLRQLDICVASVHGPLIESGTVEENTRAYCAVLENPYVDILGHSGNPNFLYDLDTVIGLAKEKNKIIEINEHTFVVRPDNVARCVEIAKKCKELGVYIAVNTDAHVSYDVGRVPNVERMLSELDFPQELILNLSAGRVMEYLNQRPGREKIE